MVRGRTLKTNTTEIYGCVWGGWTTLDLPLTNVTCLFWVHPSQCPICNTRSLSQVGPIFHALPRSEPIRHLGAWQGPWPWLSMCFVLFPGPKTQVTVWWARHCPSWAVYLIQLSGPRHSFCCLCQRTQSQLCRVSPQGSWSQAVTILTYVNCPWSQEFMVSNCHPA